MRANSAYCSARAACRIASRTAQGPPSPCSNLHQTSPVVGRGFPAASPKHCCEGGQHRGVRCKGLAATALRTGSVAERAGIDVSCRNQSLQQHESHALYLSAQHSTARPTVLKLFSLSRSVTKPSRRQAKPVHTLATIPICWQPQVRKGGEGRAAHLQHRGRN